MSLHAYEKYTVCPIENIQYIAHYLELSCRQIEHYILHLDTSNWDVRLHCYNFLWILNLILVVSVKCLFWLVLMILRYNTKEEEKNCVTCRSRSWLVEMPPTHVDCCVLILNLCLSLDCSYSNLSDCFVYPMRYCYFVFQMNCYLSRHYRPTMYCELDRWNVPIKVVRDLDLLFACWLCFAENEQVLV